MNSNMWEGFGGPVKMDQPELGDIDPTLAACCRREVSADEPRWARAAPSRVFPLHHTDLFLSYHRLNRIARDPCWNKR
jgi:hypothetical protein